MKSYLKYIRPVLATFAVLTVIGIISVPRLAAADCTTTAVAPSEGCCVTGNETTCPANSANCGSENNTVTNCVDPASQDTSTACTKDNCDVIKKYLNPAIVLMSGLVGIVVTISIIIGGIQYSASAGDPAAAGAAKNRIRNSLIALLAYFLLLAGLNFIIPGGIK